MEWIVGHRGILPLCTLSQSYPHSSSSHVQSISGCQVLPIQLHHNWLILLSHPCQNFHTHLYLLSASHLDFTWTSYTYKQFPLRVSTTAALHSTSTSNTITVRRIIIFLISIFKLLPAAKQGCDSTATFTATQSVLLRARCRCPHYKIQVPILWVSMKHSHIQGAH